MRTRLVERAREGDDVAFSGLVDLDGDLCSAIAYRILRDVERAQYAVQQALLLAWRELPRSRDPERFSPWLHRLLVNACYEELRRHRRWSTRIRSLPVDGPGGPDPTVSVDDRNALDGAFARLTPEHRAVFVQAASTSLIFFRRPHSATPTGRHSTVSSRHFGSAPRRSIRRHGSPSIPRDTATRSTTPGSSPNCPPPRIGRSVSSRTLAERTWIDSPGPVTTPISQVGSSVWRPSRCRMA